MSAGHPTARKKSATEWRHELKERERKRRVNETRNEMCLSHSIVLVCADVGKILQQRASRNGEINPQILSGNIELFDARAFSCRMKIRGRKVHAGSRVIKIRLAIAIYSSRVIRDLCFAPRLHLVIPVPGNIYLHFPPLLPPHTASDTASFRKLSWLISSCSQR